MHNENKPKTHWIHLTKHFIPFTKDLSCYKIDIIYNTDDIKTISEIQKILYTNFSTKKHTASNINYAQRGCTEDTSV